MKNRGMRRNSAIRPAGQLIFLAACFALIAPSAWGDVFVLKSGGQIRGRWLNRDERPLVAYEIETSHGGRMRFAKDQIEQAIFERPVVLQYEKIAPGFGDTIEEQWKLAEWCRENSLIKQRRVHLERILELDPDHPKARRGLGYSQRDGRWMTQKQWRAEKGYRYFQGRLRDEHDIKILERRQEQEEAERQWLTRLKRMRQELASENSLVAREEILAIRDPHALRGLVGLLHADPSRAAGFIYLDAIKNIGTHGAAVVLVETSLNHGDVEIFYESIEKILELDPPGVVKPYIDSLEDENNVRVNRAAFVLGRLEDRRAIEPLIDALITTHKIVQVNPQGGDAISTTFSRPGTGALAGVAAPGACRDRGAVTGLSAGGSKTSVIPVRVQNQQVLNALVKLSQGASFGFDQQAWHNWNKQEQSRLPEVTVRGE